jgi:hypothetical protein
MRVHYAITGNNSRKYPVKSHLSGNPGEIGSPLTASTASNFRRLVAAITRVETERANSSRFARSVWVVSQSATLLVAETNLKSSLEHARKLNRQH